MNSLSNNERFYIPNTLDGIDILTENISSNALLVDGSNFMMADLDAGGHNVKNVATAVALDDAVPLGQLNTTLGNYVDLTTNQTIGGTKTFSNQVIFNGATKTNLVATDIPNAGNRIWLLNDAGTSQTIAGSKNWSNSTTFNGPNLNTTGTNVNINSTNLNVSATTITNLNNGANCNNKKITNVLDPTNPQDGATKNYVDNAITGLNINNYVLKAGDTMTGNLNMNTTNKIINVLDPSNPQDVSTKNYTDTADNLKVNKAGDTMTGNLNMNTTNKIINVLDPSNPQDVSTKNYVDNAITGLNINNYLLKSGGTMTGDLSINAVLNLNGGTANDPNVDPANKTNTYIRFGEAGATSDFAYLRQIGGSNDIQIALDFHDNGTDGQFHIRSVGSIDNPDTIKPLFTSAQSGTIINYPSTSTNTQRQLALRVDNATNNGLFFHTNLSAGSYNSLVDTNDKAIIFSDGTTNTGKLVIGNWGGYGMKLDCENGSMILNSREIINKNATTFTNFDVNSTQLIDIKSGNPLYEQYTLTYNGLGSEIRIPYITQSDTTLQNKTLAFKITGSTQVFLEPLPLVGAFTTINVDGVNYVSTAYTISSSVILKGTGTIGYYTTSPYQEYISEDQLTVASNLYTDANDEFAGIRFAGSGTELGFIRVDTNRTKSDANMTFYVRQANTITTPLTINNTILANIPILCNGGTIDYQSGTIDTSNRTNTYIGFAPAGTNNDWALLRQIGGDNDYHMALDIHDDAFDGKVSFRNLESTASPDNIRTFFKATASRGFYNPISTAVRITDANNYELDNNIGITTVYSYGGQNGAIYLPNTRDTGMKIEVINLSSQNQVVYSGVPGSLSSLIKNGATTTTTTTILNNGWYSIFIWTGSVWVGHRYGGVSVL